MEMIKKVEQIIAERVKNPQDTSYTNALINKGLDKILKKIGEEASETIIAAKNDNESELVGEISDLMYHVLVMMQVKNVAWDKVDAELANRFDKGGFHGRTDLRK